ncbi:MAG: FAD-binding oxidoreductase [Ktedonobacterales bacterium]|nr:FAD-binding oxidoreductase [Ktedonobacterales bacterium]
MIQYEVRPTQELPRTADLVIIGGGIIGAATAFFAARAGLRAVVIEQRPALATLTTPAATGAFRAQFDNAEEMALVREGIALYTHFAEVTELAGYDIDIRQQGYLWIATTETTAQRQREQVRRQRAWGLADVELLSGAEAHARFPYLAPEIVQARYRAGDGWLDPRKLAMGYAAASHATFVTETAVTGFALVGGRISAVLTTRGVIATDRAVIAAGPFSGVVARMADVELALSLVRRQRVILPDVPDVPPDAPMTIDEETGAHWRPALRGAHLLWTAPGVPPGPPLEDVPPSEAFALGLLDPASDHAVARITPFWRTVWRRNTAHWFSRAGQYTYTPDHRPYLGPTAVEGLFVNCGYSGHGIMASAGGSRLVVETITGQLAPAANPFRLDRPLIERELDIL